MAEIVDGRIRLTDLPDTNKPEQDRRQVRQQIADAVGVSPEQVSVELVGAEFHACVGDQSLVLEWTDTKDFERLKLSSTSPVILALGEFSPEITIGKLAGASEGLANGGTMQVLAPRFRATLARQLNAPITLIEVRGTEKGLEARKIGGDWRPLEFAHAEEAQRFKDLAGKGGEVTNLADFGRKEKDKVLVLPPLATSSRDLRLAALQTSISGTLGVPPDQILLTASDGQLHASVVPTSVTGSVWNRLTEPFLGAKIIEVQAATPEEMTWILNEITASKSPKLTHLGTPPNPNVIKIPHYPSDLGRDAEIERLRLDITRHLGTSANKIDIFVNDEGMMQTRIRGSAKVYDLAFTTSSDFGRFNRYIVENPGTGLDTLGQRRIDNTVDMSSHTGFPDARANTSFRQFAQTRAYLDKAGMHQLRFSGELNESFADTPFQTFQVGYHHREFGGLDMRMRHKDGKYSFSAVEIESDFATQTWDRFATKLKSKDLGAIAVTGGVLVGAAALTLIAKNNLKEEQSIPLPVSAKLIDKGKFRLDAGLNTEMYVGADKLGFRFNGASGKFTENIASGIRAEQRVGFNQKENHLTLGMTTVVHRFGANVESRYSTGTGQFMYTNASLSQGIGLNEHMNLSLGTSLNLDGTWKATGLGGSAAVNYNLSDVWIFRAGTGVNWNPSAASGTPGSTPTMGFDLGFRARF